MKVKLLRDARIKHFAGEIVEVSTEEAGFLFSVGGAVVEPITAPEEVKVTPEDGLPETEERKTVTRTTRKVKK